MKNFHRILAKGMDSPDCGWDKAFGLDPSFSRTEGGLLCSSYRHEKWVSPTAVRSGKMAKEKGLQEAVDVFLPCTPGSYFPPHLTFCWELPPGIITTADFRHPCLNCTM